MLLLRLLPCAEIYCKSILFTHVTWKFDIFHWNYINQNLLNKLASDSIYNFSDFVLIAFECCKMSLYKMMHNVDFVYKIPKYQQYYVEHLIHGFEIVQCLPSSPSEAQTVKIKPKCLHKPRVHFISLAMKTSFC